MENWGSKCTVYWGWVGKKLPLWPEYEIKFTCRNSSSMGRKNTQQLEQTCSPLEQAPTQPFPFQISVSCCLYVSGQPPSRMWGYWTCLGALGSLDGIVVVCLCGNQWVEITPELQLLQPGELWQLNPRLLLFWYVYGTKKQHWLHSTEDTCVCVNFNMI